MKCLAAAVLLAAVSVASAAPQKQAPAVKRPGIAVRTTQRVRNAWATRQERRRAARDLKAFIITDPKLKAFHRAGRTRAGVAWAWTAVTGYFGVVMTSVFAQENLPVAIGAIAIPSALMSWLWGSEAHGRTVTANSRTVEKAIKEGRAIPEERMERWERAGLIDMSR